MTEPVPLRILVTGSRGWENHQVIADGFVRAVQWWISQHPTNAHVPTSDWVTLVDGACPRGADQLAHVFADGVLGWRTERYPAQWRRADGSKNDAAGLERNAYMVSLGANLCLCFVTPCAKFAHQNEPPHPSHGAQHCATLAQAAGIKVVTFYPDGQVKEGPP